MPERVIKAGETLFEPGGDVIHYQNGNALSDAPSKFVVFMLCAPGQPMLTLVDEEELAKRAHLRHPRPTDRPAAAAAADAAIRARRMARWSRSSPAQAQAQAQAHAQAHRHGSGHGGAAVYGPRHERGGAAHPLTRARVGETP
ncbi:hypothetical protein GCM10009574_068950 [Streptomyces asiaticus]